jgi:predicted N-acetyltransferase YhbS
MIYRQSRKEDTSAIIQLFESVFTDSEGKTEGALIGRLAEDFFKNTDEHDLFNFVAEEDDRIIGSIFFSRSDFDSGLEAFILAPVAVHSDHQGKGIGQALINHGLQELKDRGVAIVITYGDPGFYHKVGFRQVSHYKIRPPFELSLPEGWQGQSLVGDSLESLSGAISCVEALRNPAYW